MVAGSLSRREAIQAAWRWAKSRASRNDARFGIVNTASRAAKRTRKVNRRAFCDRRKATRIVSPAWTNVRIDAPPVGVGPWRRSRSIALMLAQRPYESRVPKLQLDENISLALPFCARSDAGDCARYRWRSSSRAASAGRRATLNGLTKRPFLSIRYTTVVWSTE